MATQKKTRKGGALWEKAKWQGFVNVRLKEQERKYIKDNLLQEVTGYEFLMNAATEGYKCSISYSTPEDVYTVSLTGQYQRRPNAGVTMSMRHRDLIVALTALSFIATEDGLYTEWSERFSVGGDDDW